MEPVLFNDPEFPRIGLGCMGMSEFYGPTDDTKSHDILMAAYDMGYRLFDTADMYGFGRNESLIGTFLKRLEGNRSEITVATKVGIHRNPSEPYKLNVDASPPYIARQCEASLRRLGTDHIDLYYVHRLDPVVPIEETAEAMARLRQSGKIRLVGLCEASAQSIERFHAICRVDAVQSEYSLWTRDAEIEVIPKCQEIGARFVAFSPLGRGFLTGRIDDQFMRRVNAENDFRARLPRFHGDNFASNSALVQELSNLARQNGVKPSQLALAWLLHKSPITRPIPGTRTPAYLSDNWESLDVRVSEADMERLDETFSPTNIRGARYPDEILKRSNA